MSMLKNRKRDDGKSLFANKNTILVCGNRFPDHHTTIPMLIFIKEILIFGILTNKNSFPYFPGMKSISTKKNQQPHFYVLYNTVILITLKLCSTEEI